MLDQVFGRISSSQWIVFLALVILLVGLSELAWRLGFSRSRKRPVEEKGVITRITDIDTPRGGLIALDERPLLELNETLNRLSASKGP
jgi:hypothetical protein